MKCRICGQEIEDSNLCVECKKTLRRRKVCAVFIILLIISWPILAMFIRFF